MAYKNENKCSATLEKAVDDDDDDNNDDDDDDDDDDNSTPQHTSSTDSKIPGNSLTLILKIYSSIQEQIEKIKTLFLSKSYC